jgi:hypothetical protein
MCGTELFSRRIAMTAERKRIVSGIRPTGFVHLGNYLWRHS